MSNQGRPPAQDAGYLQGLDGIRAFAVLAVVLFHANLPAVLPAGFLGVDIFFVLSGFLITRLLLLDLQGQGHIDTGRFYIRRIKRLLPAIVALVLSVLAYAYFVQPDAWEAARKDAPSALFYYANFWQMYDQQPYFAQFGRPSAFQHFWSLAIEEQFYIFWPLVLALLYRLRRWLPLALPIGLLALASVGWMWWLAQLHNIPLEAAPERLYLSTDTHAHGLLFGAFLACIYPKRPLLLTGWRNWLLGLLGLASLVFLGAFLSFSNEGSEFLYRGGFSLVELATVLLILAASSPGNISNRLLNSAVLSWVGRRSYSLYLWHWPVFVFFRPGYELPENTWQACALRLVLTLALAQLCYHFIETPLRKVQWRRLSTLGKAAVLSATAAVVAALVYAYVFAPQPLLSQASDEAVLDSAQMGESPSANSPTEVLGATLAASAASDAASQIEQGSNAAADDPHLPPLILPLEILADDELLKPSPSPTQEPKPSLEPSVAPSSQAGLKPISATSTPAESASLNLTSSKLILGKVSAPSPQLHLSPTPVPNPSPSPSPTATPQPQRISAFGDSVMLGARAALLKKIPQLQVDAKVGRQASDLVKILQKPEQQSQLAPWVLIHIGTNGYIYEKNMDKLMTLLKDQERVVFVTIHADRRWTADNNVILRKTREKHPNVLLVDWDAQASARRDLLVQDGIHLSGSGMQSYAQLLYAAFPAQATQTVQTKAHPTSAAAGTPVVRNALVVAANMPGKKIPNTNLPAKTAATELPVTSQAELGQAGSQATPQASATPTTPALTPSSLPSE